MLQPGPEISSRPIVRDDHTKRPDDYENNYSRPVDDHVFLNNLSQALLHTRYFMPNLVRKFVIKDSFLASVT